MQVEIEITCPCCGKKFTQDVEVEAGNAGVY